MLSTFGLYFILIFFSLIALVIAYLLWHWLPLFLLIGNVVFVLSADFLLANNIFLTCLSAVLFIFGIPSFTIIGVYYFIYWAFFKKRARTITIQMPTIVVRRGKP